MRPILDGLLTGLLLQLALGPVFFYIVGITLDSTVVNVLCAIIAVTIVDFFYIWLAIIGVANIIQRDRFSTIIRVLGSLILILFGAAIMHKGVVGVTQPQFTLEGAWTPIKSFTSCFVLTISSPMTIVFFSGIFSTKAIEKGYQKDQLYYFGFGTGSATFFFLTLSMLAIHFVKSGISNTIIQVMYCIVGIVLIYYGVTRSRVFLPKKEN